MKKKQIEAMIKLSKKSERECKTIRPNLAGAYYDKDKNRTYICNSYWGIWIDGFVDGLKMREVKGYYPCLENLVGKKYEYISAEIDYDELKQKAKAYRKENTNDYLIKIEKSYFNPQYVLSIIDCFDTYNVSVHSIKHLLLIESDGITAIICGIREVK